MVGKSLGPYQILEHLGSGGMGEVYLALDSRLRRKVAIKVLPEEYASDPERLARFTQEARAAAALNHANIAVIHDVGEAGGTHFMVQEYLQGSTLQDVLAGGRLPVKRALRLGSEIAAALATAHASGIVHRDLKPANIFVIEGDHAKVLDFGLAKLMQTDHASDADLTRTPTALGTVAGVIMGTAGYMAPEQIRGTEIDQRADVFAFGCVFYEMVSGERSFVGDTAVEILNAILNSEPTALVEIDPTLPMDLVRVINKCLAKEPGRRYQNSDDLVVDLASLSDDVAHDSALSIGSYIRAEAKERPAVARARHPLWWPTIAGLLALTAALAGYAGREFLSRSSPVAPVPVTRFSIDLPADQALTQSSWTLPLALSPDGKRLVYTAGSPSQLYLREFDDAESRPIPGTENGDSPFFSPDGEWVGFSESLSRLKRVRLSTGEMQTICECRFDGGDFVWRPDDVIVYPSLGAGGKFMSVPAAGGTPTTFAVPEIETAPAADPSGNDDSAGILPGWPVLLPDGETLLALIYTDIADDDTFIGVASKTEGGWRRLTEPGFVGTEATGPLRYVASGHLVYSDSGALVAVPFDPVGLEFRGSPRVVIPAIEQPLSYGSPAFFTVSANGSLVAAAPRPASAQSSLVWVDHRGETRPLRATAGEYQLPRLSPDGSEAVADSGAHVWLIDLERNTETRLSVTKSAVAGHPTWTRSGTEVVLERAVVSARLAWMRTDSTGAARTLTTRGVMLPNDWAPDGALALTRYLGYGYDIVTMPFDESLAPRPVISLVETPANEGAASFSPSGNWLAYTSDESGRFEVYAQPYPGPGRRWTISSDGGTSPAFSPDGRTLFYRAGSRMMAVAVETGSTLNPGTARVLFDNPGLMGVTGDGTGRNYDVAPDGQRFVMVQEPGPWAPRLNVVLNWFQELNTRVPATR